MKYDIIFLGGGQAGIFGAYEAIEKKEDLNQKNFILKYMTPVDENNQESFMSIFSSFLKYFGITMEGTPDQPVIPAVDPDTKKDGEDQTKKEMEARDLQEKGK